MSKSPSDQPFRRPAGMNLFEESSLVARGFVPENSVVDRSKPELITTIDDTLQYLRLGISIDVHGHWQRGFPGDREQPEEKAGWEVAYIVIDGHQLYSGRIFDLCQEYVNHE